MLKKFQCRNPIKLLADDEIQDIHNQTLQVLEEVGLHFEDEDALCILEQNGCVIDQKKGLARIPNALVEKSISQCPPSITLRGRNRDNAVVFDRETIQFGPCSGMRIMEISSRKTQPGTAIDAIRTARLADALDIMAGVNIGLGFISDRPADINLVWSYVICCRNSGKIFSLGSMEDSVKWGIRIAEVSEQDIIIPVSSTSPLGWHAEQISTVKHAAKSERPVTIQSMASPGITAPITLSGTAIVMNAEILGMLVLAQILKPGMGVIYSCFTLPMDMRLGTLASGSIELAMLTVVSAQLSKFYGIGSMIWGPNTDSKAYDEQCGYEKAMQWLLAAQAGINLIWGAGMIENHTIWSDEQLIVDAEICERVGRYLDGIDTGGGSSNFETIKEVGHFPGNYLMQPQTLQDLSKEHYFPTISSRHDYDSWKKLKPRDLMERAESIVSKILDQHEAPALTPEADREVENILFAAAKEKGLESPYLDTKRGG